MEKPVIQCITNIVTVNDCANVTLAAGGSPTMAHHIEEAGEIQVGCHGLVLNLGATDDFDAMLLAAAKATELGHPIIVDPVGCGGSSFRRKFFKKLRENCSITCIRGNVSEIVALAEDGATTTGVDSRLELKADVTELTEKAAVKLSRETGAFVVVSGATDIVTDGKEIFKTSTGDELMSCITGAGCMSTCLIGVFLARENSFEALKDAVLFYNSCGEAAAQATGKKQGGSMTFRLELIDEIYRRTFED